jgi:hypothetical protein
MWLSNYMQRDIHSYNSSIGPSLQQFLLPSLPKLLLELLIGAFLLTALNIRSIWTYFTSGILATTQFDLGDLINQKARGLHDFLNNISRGRFLQIVFWLFVGCIIYLLIWFIGNLITNVRNDIVADEYMHPAAYNRKNYWESVIARKIFFWCIVVVLIAYISAAFRFCIALAKYCNSALINFSWSRSLVVVVASIVITAILLQLLTILARIVANSWQFIYRDL